MTFSTNLTRLTCTLIFTCNLILGLSSKVQADSETITILHTNDIHSHYRPDGSPRKLGGIGRIKTTVDRIRKEEPNTLLVDAGDWSEGNIYYTDGGGTEAIKMMDRLGYDFAVLGNHDWLNGPDHLLQILDQTQPRTQFLSANLYLDKYTHKDQFKKWVLPYSIRTVAGVKIAFIGLSTYEFIYDKFFSPISITEPFYTTRDLAEELKESGQADFVIAISHNSIFANKNILTYAPALDLVISGHQHKKLIKPIVVHRREAWAGWVVEAGCWSEYLGKLELKVSNGKVSLSDYKLIQMDETIPEDPTVVQAIEDMERRIESKQGPIFHDKIGESKVEFSRTGVNNSMGNLVTDAYLKKIGGDFSLDVIKFITGMIHRGPIRSVDIFNAIPSVYNPTTGKTWTVKTLPVTGRALKWFLYLLHSSNKVASLGLVATSGLSFLYDPFIAQAVMTQNLSLQSYLANPASFELSGQANALAIPPVKEIKIQGQPIDMNTTYQMVTGQGTIESIEFIDKNIYNGVPLDQMKDHGIESWKVLSNYVQSISPITLEQVPFENRMQTIVADLGVYPEDIEWNPLGHLQIRVKNYGAKDSIEGDPTSGARIQILQNKNGSDTTVEPEYVDLTSPILLPSLKPGESVVIGADLDMKEVAKSNSIRVRIQGDSSESNLTNNEATFFLN